MTESGPTAAPTTPLDAVERSQRLAARLGVSEGALSALLLTYVGELGAGLMVKQAASGRYLHADERAAGLIGLEPGQVIDRTDAELFGPETAAALRSADQTAAGLRAVHRSAHRLERDRQRREFDVLRLVMPAAADSSEPSEDLMVCLWVETTLLRMREAQLGKALKQLEQQQVATEALRREAQDAGLRDNVTGLYQRAQFDEQLRREVDLSSREHREFALVSIELDDLPDEVRALGPEAATRVLESLGRLLRNNTRAMDASCRIDADHFAVLLSGVGLATAHSRMEGLRRQCATQIVVLEGREIGFTVSMGVASFPHTAHSQDELVKAADLALGEAVRRGGNHVTLASIRFEN